MSTVTADQKRRVILPGATPGDVFDVQPAEGGRYVLEKLIRPAGAGRYSSDEVMDALDSAPLNSRMSWRTLKGVTRES